MPRSATIKRAPDDFPIDELDNEAWKLADPIKTKSNWNGQRAPKHRRFETRLLWTETGLYVRFDAAQGEALVINKFPNLREKTNGLWDRDVCELFIAPDKNAPNKYFELEVAPTGEWLDLQVQLAEGERRVNSDWISGIQTNTTMTRDLVVIAFRVKWEALGATPAAGDVWLGNLFRCVGKSKVRGYLAWSATRTEEPNFHVPQRFGEFTFAG